MKVLMVSAAILPFWKCGVATVVEQLANQLQHNGHSVGMFALEIHKNGDREIEQFNRKCWLTDVNISDKSACIPNDSEDSLHIIDRFKMCLREFKPDVVHFHTPRYFCLSLIEEAKKHQARVIMTLHDWWWLCPIQFYAPELGKICEGPNKEKCITCMKKTSETSEDYDYREKAILSVENLIDCFSCVSTILYNDLIKYKPYLKHKAIVIPNPVSSGAMPFNSFCEPMTFAFLGGQSDIKGYNQVLDAFNSIPSSEKWKLNVYGCTIISNTVQEQSNREFFIKMMKYLLHPRLVLRKCKTMIKSHMSKIETNGCISFYPSFTEDERTNILSKTHVVLVCSQVQESFSLVTYEAMVNGCCVISTPCGGPKSIVKTGYNGILLDDFDAETIKHAVLYLLEHRTETERMRENAYKQARKFNSCEKVTELFESIYRND